MVGFDFARTFNPSTTLGTAQGMVNMGGFIASLLVMQAMGLVIGAVGGYSLESFRVAWTVQYVIWAFAVTGILITRRKARRRMQEERSLLEGFASPSPNRRGQISAAEATTLDVRRPLVNGGRFLTVPLEYSPSRACGATHIDARLRRTTRG
jgi:hypothetical protein